MRRPRGGLFIFILLILLCIPSFGEAISNTETFGGFEFNFNNPGARAIGMGGAFIAVADDATAAASNPAGLVILQRPEISGEVKFTQFTNTINAYSNSSTDAWSGRYESRDFDDNVTTPSFFSFVYPTKLISAAVFLREEVNYKSTFHKNGIFTIDPKTLGYWRHYPVQSDMEINVRNYGIGVGINLAKNHPLLPNLGASVEFAEGVVNAKLQRFGFGTASEKFYSAPDFSRNNVYSTTLVSGTDLSTGFNVGALWRPSKDLSIGIVYRKGPRFKMQQTVDEVGFDRDFFDFSLKIPDVYGAGVSYRFFDRLTIGLDVVRIQYSQLLDNFQVIYERTNVRPEDFNLDDATEVHVGAEYVFFARDIPFALRIGFYTDPDHKIRYIGATDNLNGKFNSIVFPGGKDRNHYTAGLGFVPTQGFQIDFATNQSDSVKEYVISTVYRF